MIVSHSIQPGAGEAIDKKPGSGSAGSSEARQVTLEYPELVAGPKGCITDGLNAVVFGDNGVDERS